MANIYYEGDCYFCKHIYNAPCNCDKNYSGFEVLEYYRGDWYDIQTERKLEEQEKQNEKKNI